jgi:murein L,D-transpeptidase YafK
MNFIFTFSILIPLLFSLQNKSTGLSLEKRISLIEDKVKKRSPDLVKKLDQKDLQISLFAFKKEQVLEVWQMKPTKLKLKSYAFTKYSGYLGPKSRQGDQQIPEGVYKIDLLNPNSKYYLSMRINYPNDLDKKRGEQYNINNMGGDIYIHGSNKTVGCIPIGNDNIEDLFYLVYKVGFDKVSVTISPSRLPLPMLKDMGLLPHDIQATQKYEKIKASLKEISP